MSNPLTFGVEIEFALACHMLSTPHPHPLETRTTTFTPAEIDWFPLGRSQTPAIPPLSKSVGNITPRVEEAFIPAGVRHVAQTLHTANFPINPTDNEHLDHSIHNWAVETDSSVDGPRGSKYSYLPIEVKSPAYFFSATALKEVERACALLTSTYCINVNSTCGLHVHVGDSKRGFPFSMLKNLAAFLWAFEPQINTLHPVHRQNGLYCHSMRGASRFAELFERKWGRQPRVLETVRRVLRCESLDELIKQLAPRLRQAREGAYNFTNLSASEREMYFGAEFLTRTLEFRQHEGCVEGERVVKWIETVVGIVEYLRNVSASELYALLEVGDGEKWQKVGDGKDERREKEFGPILAERDYTVVHLLQSIGLQDCALFYSSRWRKVKASPGISMKNALWTPDTEDELDSSSGDGLQRIYEALRSVVDLQTPAGVKALAFDPDDEMWTGLDRKNMDKESDVSSQFVSYET